MKNLKNHEKLEIPKKKNHENSQPIYTQSFKSRVIIRVASWLQHVLRFRYLKQLLLHLLNLSKLQRKLVLMRMADLVVTGDHDSIVDSLLHIAFSSCCVHLIV